jgi:phosphoglycerate dehydrogenase-like enzyme
MKCLIATSFQGLEAIKRELEEVLDCTYLPEINLPVDGLEDIEVLVVNPNNLKFKLDALSLSGLVNLKFVLTISTGVAHIDLEYLHDRNVKLISLKEKTHLMNDITATAELAFLFLLAHARKLKSAISEDSVRIWDWRPFEGKQINELKIGIIGYGRLGKLFESYCKSFGASPMYYDPFVTGGVDNQAEIFSICDVVSLHSSFTPGMEIILSAEALDLAKTHLHVINTARGELVDESALAAFLSKNPYAHYSADVIANESSKENSPIYGLWSV